MKALSKVIQMQGLCWNSPHRKPTVSNGEDEETGGWGRGSHTSARNAAPPSQALQVGHRRAVRLV